MNALADLCKDKGERGKVEREWISLKRETTSIIIILQCKALIIILSTGHLAK